VYVASEWQYTCSRWRNQAPWGVVFMIDGMWNKENHTYICEANPILHEIYHSVVNKLGLSNTANLPVLIWC